MLRFRIGRIPVEAQAGHFLMAALLGYPILQSFGGRTGAILLSIWVAVVFLSVLFHELGHALVASAFGYRPTIQLVWTGGLTQPNAPTPMPWYRDVAVTIAGPAFGLLLYALSSGIASQVHASSPLVRMGLGQMIFVNRYWSLLNLVPVLPLDGGHIAYTLFIRFLGRRGFLFSQILGLGVSVAVILWSLAGGDQISYLMVLFAIFGLRAFSGISAYLRGEVPEAQKNAAEIPLANAESLYQQGHLAEAKQVAEGVLETQTAGLKLRSRTHHLLGWIAIKEGQGRAALDHFSQVQGERVLPQGLAAGFSLIGDDARALPLWELAYAETKDRTVLHEWAGALIRSGRLEEAAKIPGVDTALAYDCAERVLFIRGEFAAAAQIGLAALEQFPRPEIAYDVACSLAQAGDLERALRLLDRAAELGFRNTSVAASDPDLAALRNDPRFEDWLGRIKSQSH